MANLDKARGAHTIGEVYEPSGPYTAAAAIKGGDFVTKNAAGLIALALATDTSLYGVAVHDADSGDLLLVYDHKDQRYSIQCSGDSAVALGGDTCDIEGGTGVMEANENATVTNVLFIHDGAYLGDLDHTEVGTHGLVVASINKPQTQPSIAYTDDAAVVFAGTLTSTGYFAVGAKAGITAADGSASFADGAATIDATGDAAVADLDASGNTTCVALTTTGAVACGTTLGVTGISTLAGLANLDGGIAVDTNKFVVADTGAVTLGLDIAGQTTTLNYTTQVMTNPVTKAEGELLQTAFIELLTILGVAEQHILTATVT